MAHAQGALVTVNHPISQREKAPNFPSFEQMLAWGVDYIEVQGQNIYDKDAVEFCSQHGLGMISGTDIHFPIPVNGWTALNVPEFAKEAIIEQLHARNTQVIYDPKGSPDYTIRDLPISSKHWIPFIGIGQMLSITDHSQLKLKGNVILTFLFVLIVLFLFAELLGWAIRLISVIPKFKLSDFNKLLPREMMILAM